MFSVSNGHSSSAPHCQILFLPWGSGYVMNYPAVAGGHQNLTKGFSGLGDLPKPAAPWVWSLESPAGSIIYSHVLSLAYKHPTHIKSNVSKIGLDNCLSLIFYAGPGIVGLTAGLSEGDLVSLVSRVSFGISRTSSPPPSSASPSVKSYGKGKRMM